MVRLLYDHASSTVAGLGYESSRRILKLACLHGGCDRLAASAERAGRERAAPCSVRAFRFVDGKAAAASRFRLIQPITRVVTAMTEEGPGSTRVPQTQLQLDMY